MIHPAIRRRARFAPGVALCLALIFVVAASGCTSSNSPGSERERRDFTSCLATAAQSRDWGSPDQGADFTQPNALKDWYVYDSPGHGGNGRRTPSAVTIASGGLTITADAKGNSGGVSWKTSQKYGRWEVCMKSSVAAPSYHSVALLWPDAEDWPAGGEIDFMEIVDPTRRNVEAWMHYGSDDRRIGGNVNVDATQWHAWAVEWTPDHIASFVDGQQFWMTDESSHFPPRPMHLCIQLDNFGGDVSAGGRQDVEWARQYPIR